MGSSVKVLSTDALKDFRVALSIFLEQSKEALIAVDMESRRFMDWLNRDQKTHWERQKRLWTENLSEAKLDLNRRMLQRTAGGNRPDVSEQRKVVKRCENKLEEAEQKLRNIKKWSMQAQKAIEEYIGKANRLANLLEGDPPPAIVDLDRILMALEQYLAVHAPQTSGPTGLEADSKDSVAQTGINVSESETNEESSKESTSDNAPKEEDNTN